jgi:hypothetical protein
MIAVRLYPCVKSRPSVEISSGLKQWSSSPVVHAFTRRAPRLIERRIYLSCVNFVKHYLLSGPQSTSHLEMARRSEGLLFGLLADNCGRCRSRPRFRLCNGIISIGQPHEFIDHRACWRIDLDDCIIVGVDLRSFWINVQGRILFYRIRNGPQLHENKHSKRY